MAAAPSVVHARLRVPEEGAGRGRQSPRAPSHARAAALLSRPRGRLEDQTEPWSKGWSARGDSVAGYERCCPEPDLHPALGCQPEAQSGARNSAELLVPTRGTV